MVLLLTNLGDRGKSREVQRLDRNDEPRDFYLGPDLHVLLDYQFEGVGDEPIHFYLEVLEKDRSL